VLNSAGNLSVSTFPAEGESDGASGCLVDATITCVDRFPQDDPLGSNTTLEYSRCNLNKAYSVTLLSGIHVDPIMLAAYAGIATRNNGINTPEFLRNHPFAVNSIAAAYVLTREIVPGTVAVPRASIGPGYICFLLLPLGLAVLLLIAFLKPGSSPPVPRSVWDAIVLGRGEEKVPRRDGSDSAFPSCPSAMKYGIIADAGKEYDHLGLGDQLFVPLARPLSERDLKDTNSIDSTDHREADGGNNASSISDESDTLSC